MLVIEEARKAASWQNFVTDAGEHGHQIFNKPGQALGIGARQIFLNYIFFAGPAIACP